MFWLFAIVLFLASCVALSWISSSIIKSLIQIAKYLGWREFVVAFFVMAFAASLPNLFVDVGAALQDKAQLSFGDIIGGNLFDLTLVLAIAVFFSKKGLSTESTMVQESAVFTSVIAVLPLLLVLDRHLGRIDGVVLIASFIFYAWWMFSKKERFEKIYSSRANRHNSVKSFKEFLLNLAKIIVFLVLLLFAAQAVIGSAQFFADKLGVSLALVGILIVGLGNCLPETYFAVVAAREHKNWMVLGDLMGSVIVCATLVLGIVALVAPFSIADFSPFLVTMAFLVAAALLSILLIRTGNRVTKKEGLVLLFFYIAFLIFEIFVNY